MFKPTVFFKKATVNDNLFGKELFIRFTMRAFPALLSVYRYTVNSRYLKVEVYPKLLISQSKFSGPRKFTLRYQYYVIKVKILRKIKNVSELHVYSLM